MTLIAVSIRQDAVEILTDTTSVAKGYGGRLMRTNKITALPHVDAAIMTAGNFLVGTLMTRCLEEIAGEIGFDALCEVATSELREVFANHVYDGGRPGRARVILVGNSPEVDAFTGFTFDSQESFRPRPIPEFHLQPMPRTHRPCDADLDALLYEAETDGLGEQELAAEIVSQWSEMPPFPRPKDVAGWAKAALYVREHCALQEFNKTMVAGSAYLTRLERGAISTFHLLDFNDKGDELRRLVRGTQHPLAQLDVCPDCDSGRAYLDCHLADQLDQPCGCGSEDLFRDCCMVAVQ